jgi:hypothetical protein
MPDEFSAALDRARLERLERKVDMILEIIGYTGAPAAPQPQDCGCPRHGYVCNNVACPRAVRVTS